MKNRMSDLRKSKEKSIMDVAYDLELPITTYQQYEAGTREPPFAMLIRIADYYGCTLDYLLMRSEIFETPTDADLEFSFQYNRLLDEEERAALNTLIKRLEKRLPT